MYLIDKTFFYGSIDIANLDELCNGNPAFVLDISQYEKEALINTLGAVVTKELLNQFEFVAVLLEYFFESPEEFKLKFPSIFLKVKQMINYEEKYFIVN